VDGVCCDVTCGGPCQACVESKSRAPSGLCNAIPAGADPDEECGRDDPMSCGNEGSCDGAGGCRRYPVGTTCADARCVGNVFHASSACSGQGGCSTPPTQDCGLSRCASSGCPGKCQNQGECVDSAYCDDGSTCRDKKALGLLCAHDYECMSGKCLMVLVGLLCSPL
jgi:hypothetical protein